MIYIVSTMANSVEYCKYDNSRNDINVLLDSVVIEGKTGTRDKKTLVFTNGGVVTPVSEKQYEWLKENPLFKLHQDNGFIKVERTKLGAESKAEKEAEVKDKSAQLTSKDFEEMEIEKPKLSAEEVATTE